MELILQLFLIRQVQQVFAYKQLIGNILCGIFYHHVVFVHAKHNTDRLIVSF